MSKFDSTNSYIQKNVLPKMTKLGNNKILKAISTGMMLTLPITLGAAIFSLFGSFPIPAVAKYLTKIGVAAQLNSISSGTLGVLGILITLTISYSYTKELKANPVVGTLFSAASYLTLMPQTVQLGKQSIGAFSASYLGSQGIFVGMLIAILIPLFYAKLIKNKHIVMKMPAGVPPMVSQSFEPVIVGVLVLVVDFIVRMIFAYTPFQDIFTFINKIVAEPLMNIGGSVPALFIVYVLANVLFFFGIHPNAIMSVINPIMLPMTMTAIAQWNAGKPVIHETNLLVWDFMNNDATGSTLGLMIIALLFAKSKRYKKLSKMAIIPNMFQINEPVIFGFPIMLNPIMFIPFVLSTIVCGLVGWGAYAIGFIPYFNPNFNGAIMPWTVPKFISAFFTMGWQGAVVRVILIILMALLYYPFFKIADKQAYEAEVKAQEGTK